MRQSSLEFLLAFGRRGGEAQIEVFEILELGKSSQSLIADLRPLETQDLQLLERLEVRQARVGDVRSFQVQNSGD